MDGSCEACSRLRSFCQCGAYPSAKSPEDALREKIASDQSKAEWMEACKVKDDSGISINMLDHAVAIFAEGFGTGETDIRHLLYCVIRDALASTSEVEQLRGLLFRARKFVEDDVLMADAITRHAPLPPDAQAVHDYTECLSERLLREIDSALTNTPSMPPTPPKDTP